MRGKARGPVELLIGPSSPLTPPATAAPAESTRNMRIAHMSLTTTPAQGAFRGPRGVIVRRGRFGRVLRGRFALGIIFRGFGLRDDSRAEFLEFTLPGRSLARRGAPAPSVSDGRLRHGARHHLAGPLEMSFHGVRKIPVQRNHCANQLAREVLGPAGISIHENRESENFPVFCGCVSTKGAHAVQHARLHTHPARIDSLGDVFFPPCRRRRTRPETP